MGRLIYKFWKSRGMHEKYSRNLRWICYKLCTFGISICWGRTEVESNPIESFQESESEFYRLRKFLTEGGDLLGDPLVMLMTLSDSPFWKRLPFFKSSYNRVAKNFLGLMEFFDQQISKNQKLFSSDLESVEEATNYVQAFLAEMKRRERNGVDMGEFT